MKPPTTENVPWARPSGSLAAAVAAELLKVIATPDFAPGGKLQAEPELARRFQVSRTTIRAAVADLESQGLLRRRQGAGTFVVGDVTRVRNTLNVNSGVTDLIAAAGWAPGTARELSSIRGCSSEEESLLVLAAREQILVIARTRTADGRPVVYAIDSIPLNSSRIGSRSTRSTSACARAGLSMVSCVSGDLRPITAKPRSGPARPPARSPGRSM